MIKKMGLEIFCHNQTLTFHSCHRMGGYSLSIKGGEGDGGGGGGGGGGL